MKMAGPIGAGLTLLCSLGRLISQNHVISIPFFSIPEAYFLHLVRLAINRMLWTKASNSRKNLRGLHVGIDKDSTVKLLNSNVLSPYDKGILRAILPDGIAAQKYLFSTKQAQHPVCNYCWQEIESLEHLFWFCPAWDNIRRTHLSNQQILQCQQLPLPIQRSGNFLTTVTQTNQFVLSHQQVVAEVRPDPMLPHDCTFIQEVQQIMVDIIKARNQTDASDPPDDFDPSPFIPNQPAPAACAPVGTPSPTDNPETNNTVSKASISKPTHSPEGFVLSTSIRPGSSKCQLVTYNTKQQTFRVCIPYQGKRHCWGPFQSDVDAARRVKKFFDELDQGIEPPTRGEKRTSAFRQDLEAKLSQLNVAALSEKRREVFDTQKPTCRHCRKSVHTYHALKFAAQPCHILTKAVDKKRFRRTWPKGVRTPHGYFAKSH